MNDGLTLAHLERLSSGPVLEGTRLLSGCVERLGGRGSRVNRKMCASAFCYRVHSVSPPAAEGGQSPPRGRCPGARKSCGAQRRRQAARGALSSPSPSPAFTEGGEVVLNRFFHLATLVTVGVFLH